MCSSPLYQTQPNGNIHLHLSITEARPGRSEGVSVVSQCDRSWYSAQINYFLLTVMTVNMFVKPGNKFTFGFGLNLLTSPRDSFYLSVFMCFEKSGSQSGMKTHLLWTQTIPTKTLKRYKRIE